MLRQISLIVAAAGLVCIQGCSDSSDDLSAIQNLPVWTDAPCDSAEEAGRYDEVMLRWQEQTDAVPYAPGRTVFTGSSSIRFWERLQQEMSDWAPIQRGFGGAITWEVAEYIEETVTRHKPDAVVLFAGTNDIAAGLTPESVATAYRCVVERIAASLGDGVSIHYISITPTPSRWPQWAQADTANQLIRDITEDWPGLYFIDTTPAFLATGEPPDDSLFISDGLHLSDKGYALWRDEIYPHLAASVQRVHTEPDQLPPGTRILVDLGPSNPEDGNPTVSPDAFGQHWNNWSPTPANTLLSSGEHIGNLADTTGQPTGVRLVFAAAIHSALGVQDGGLLEPSTDQLGNLAVAAATQDYIFARVNPTILGGRGALTVEGLHPESRYTLRLFASREDSQTRHTRYTATGKGGASQAVLAVSGSGIGQDGEYDGNDSEVATLSDLKPDAYGRLHLDFESVEATSGSNAYLALLELTVQ